MRQRPRLHQLFENNRLFLGLECKLKVQFFGRLRKHFFGLLKFQAVYLRFQLQKIVADIGWTQPCFAETELQERLRLGDPSIVARVREGALIVDLRTLQEGEDVLIAEALGKLCGSG